MSSPADLAKKRRECRERVRSHRLKKKKSLSVPNTSTGSADEGKVYKTLQALGNSESMVKQVLPNSPRKRRAVIFKLAKSVDGISSNSPNRGNKLFNYQFQSRGKQFSDTYSPSPLLK